MTTPPTPFRLASPPAALALALALASACTTQSATPDDGALPADAAAGDLASAPDGGLPDAAPVEPRLLALARDGHAASLDLTAPFAVRATADLGGPVRSARCRGGRCVVVQPSPSDSIRLIAASDLSVIATIPLQPGSDPRDAAFVDDRTLLVSQYNSAALIAIDLVTRVLSPIDLAPLADADGLPEADRLATCGRRVYAQLRRVDHDSGAPSAVPAVLAVIDLDRAGAERLVDADPNTPGVQGIALADRPAFDMPIDCAAGTLYVAEPMPLMKGGGGYEQVNLHTLTAGLFDIDTGAEVGGFEVVSPGKHWLITHTTTGPGPSSHLNLVGGLVPDTYNTFAPEHVNDLALDRTSDLLFFPDACVKKTWDGCDDGIQVFRAQTGERLTTGSVKLGFPPIEVVVAR